MSVYKRGDVWWVRFQRNGKLTRRPARTGSKRAAEAFERRLKEEIDGAYRGELPDRTFNDMMARFLNEHCPTLKKQSERRYRVSIKALQPHFNGILLKAIGRVQIHDFAVSRSRIVKTVRPDLRCLSAAFQCAIDWGWVEYNPVMSLRKRRFADVPPRRRYLTHDEYGRLIPQAKPYLRPLIVFAVATGLRLEEQLSLAWDRVDLNRREVHLVGTKSGTPRVVPLDDTAMGVLQAIQVRHLHSNWVFCKKDGSRYHQVTRGLAGAAKRADIKDLRWHDLRRTFGSWHIQAGVSMDRVSKLLGHSSVVVTERHYAFLDTESLHEAIRSGTKVVTKHAD